MPSPDAIDPWIRPLSLLYAVRVEVTELGSKGHGNGHGTEPWQKALDGIQGVKINQPARISELVRAAVPFSSRFPTICHRRVFFGGVDFWLVMATKTRMLMPVCSVSLTASPLFFISR